LAAGQVTAGGMDWIKSANALRVGFIASL